MALEVAAAQGGTETSAAIVAATPAAMDPEFAMAIIVAPEEGPGIPAAIIEDVAMIDWQVVIVVRAAVVGIAIAIVAIGVGIVSGSAKCRTGVGIVRIIA